MVDVIKRGTWMSKDKAYILLDTKITEEFHKQAIKTSEYPLDYSNMSILEKNW